MFMETNWRTYNPSYPVPLSDTGADKPRLEYTYHTSLSLQNQ